MSDYLIDNMTPEDAEEAMRWIDARIQARSGQQIYFPRVLIPKTGQTARDLSGRLYAVAFVYFERTAELAYCGWLTSNPGNTPMESYRAIRLLANAIPNYARQNGAKILLTCYGNHGLNRILDRSGFQNGETCETKFKLLI